MRFLLPTLGLCLLARGQLGLVIRDTIRARRPLSGWPFERILPAANSLIVLGDSTAFGTGATRPERSIAGLFGAAYPDWSVRVVAKNGLFIDQLPPMMPVVDGRRFTLAVIIIGGNDVLQFSTPAQMAAVIDDVLRRVKQLSHRVVLVGQGNLGASLIFSRWFAKRLTARSQTLRQIYRTVTDRYGAIFVDLYTEAADHPWRHEPQRFYAADFFHPTDDGYAMWFANIQHALRERGWGVGPSG